MSYAHCVNVYSNNNEAHVPREQYQPIPRHQHDNKSLLDYIWDALSLLTWPATKITELISYTAAALGKA